LWFSLRLTIIPSVRGYDKHFTDNLFQQIDDCDKYITENISVMSHLRKNKVQREDKRTYQTNSKGDSG